LFLLSAFSQNINESEFILNPDYVIQAVPTARSIRIHGWCLQNKSSSIELTNINGTDENKTYPVQSKIKLGEVLFKTIGWKWRGKLTMMNQQNQLDEQRTDIKNQVEEQKQNTVDLQRQLDELHKRFDSLVNKTQPPPPHPP